MDGLSTDGAAVGASKEDEARRNLAGLAGPSHGTRKLLHGIVGHRGGDQRRPDGTRRYSVDADALADVLIREAAGEGDDGALCGGVVEQIRAADVCVDGGVVDDGRAALHVW